jgi:hypothetical protein
MTTIPSNNQTTLPDPAGGPGTVNDRIDDKTRLKSKSEGPGTLGADITDDAKLSLDTKRGEVGITVNDHLDATATTDAPGGESLDVKDRLKVKAKVHKDELYVYVIDRDRVKATAKGPLDLSVNDNLGVSVDAPPGMKVVLKVHDSDKVIARSASRPQFLAQADNTKPWKV